MTKRAALLGLVVVVAIGCTSSAKVGTGPAISTTRPAGAAPSTAATTTTLPEPTTTTTTAPTAQHVGGAFSITTTGGAANITLVAVTDPAPASDSFETPKAGNRFVGTKVTLTGVTGTLTGDINNDVDIIGSDDQTYSPSFDDIAGCTNFSHGSFSVAAGATSTGCVTFEVPKTVGVKAVQLSLIGGGAAADWLVP